MGDVYLGNMGLREGNVCEPEKTTRGEWWFLWTGWRDAAFNMALDEWLMTTAANRPPTLRVYGWRHPTVSLGRNEPWRRVVKLNRLRAAGVELVRRPTGGRAVLHHRELTYSVTAPAGESTGLGVRLDDTLALVSAALARFLQRTGLDVTVCRRVSPAARHAGLCFESASRYELLARGRKVVGHAQLRTPGAFLQHGSVPVFPSVTPLWALGPGPETRTPPAGGATPLFRWSRRPLDTIARDLAFAFAEHFGARVRWVPAGSICGPEIAALRSRRYAHPKWTFRR